MDATPDDEALTALPPKARPYKTTIGLGLYLLTNPAGSKLWRFRYRLDGVAKSLSTHAVVPSNPASSHSTRCPGGAFFQ
jgi:hypothetical protein